MIPADGKAVAIVGSLDETRVRETGGYEVIGYTKSIKEPLVEQLTRFSPRLIAVNFSENTCLADGLSHGLYLSLLRYLEGTPFAGRLASSENIISKLRGRKSPKEIRRIRSAVELAEEIFAAVSLIMKPGLTERDVATFILNEVDRRGVETAWERELCPSVFTGPESAGAHAGPTDRVIEKGHVLNIDFGVKVEEYVFDLQRTWYFRKAGEKKTPAEVLRAFGTIRDSIALAAQKIRPGMEGGARG
jgi:Xaa-Pro aminopeptidase